MMSSQLIVKRKSKQVQQILDVFIFGQRLVRKFNCPKFKMSEFLKNINHNF